MNKNRVFCVCGDAGGAAALAPVLILLRADSTLSVEVLAYGPGRSVLYRAAIEFEDLENLLNDSNPKQLWMDFHPDALLYATSVNACEWEKVFVRLAQHDGIPSLSVLDFWSAYDRRFGSAEAPLSALPDLVAVMDQAAYEGMQKAGCPESRLLITGQPAFDCLANLRRQFTPEKRQVQRRLLGLNNREPLIAFFSQPFRMLMQGEDGAFARLGFDEWEVLDLLIDALEQVAERENVKICLAVKPHPRDTSPAPLRSTSRVHCMQQPPIDSQTLMLTADLVVGMNSVALVEACYLGRMTLSLQPGLLLEDSLPTNGLSLSNGVYDAKDVFPSVHHMLFDQQVKQSFAERLAVFASDGKAAQRVFDALIQLLYRN